ncbi:MAG TPA: VOC family protein [Phycisphaerales bacterium]|nr:VOC family protein [Phycisphaerales bacterium]
MQRIAQLSLTVRDYDEAIDFYTRRLGFSLLEDSGQGGGKRWVRIAPHGAPEVSPAILLAKAVGERQLATVGNQTGGRVFLFLYTDDFDADYARLQANGVTIARPRSEEDFGTVCVFEDLYGNKWDLIQPRHR